MDLAKPALDVGVYTNRIDDLRSFYESDLGLPYEELLKAGQGVHQHRLGLRGSVLKLNASREPLDDDPTGLRGLLVADESVPAPVSTTDPDGNAVTRVPPGSDGVTHLGLRWATRDPDRLGRLLADGFGAGDEGGHRWRIGTTLVLVEHDPAAAPMGPLRRRGLRYLTVQVRDVRAEHAALLAAGWTEGTAPVRLGDVAFISFVRDPGGVWVEVSQRASLTGPLPDAAPADDA